VPVNADAGKGHSISTLVRSDQPIIVERPMYFCYRPYGWTGGHDVVGNFPLTGFSPDIGQYPERKPGDRAETRPGPQACNVPYAH
jgi:hypothetical protein